MTWNAPKTWLPEAITVDKLNIEIRDNMNALKDPPHDEYAPSYAAGALVSTSSTSFADISGFDLEINTGGGDVLVILCVDVDDAAYFDIKVNNQRQGGNDGLCGVDSEANIFIPLLLTDLEPQTLSIKACWKVPSGTTSILNDSMPYFAAREVS